MKYIDKTIRINRLIINITIVDIFRREDVQAGKETGYVWPILNIDILTIGKSFGFSITTPVLKLSIGWSKK
jgi:hypothetical protein